ncbi:MAG TPA: MMPL family transporter [Thermoleophilaceae bacterium]|nr:MMPL family transporter [Thermoleophilaceae bacterium]
MARWTRFVIRNRKKVLLAWFVAVIAGAALSANLAELLSNRFSVPGAEAEEGLELLEDKFVERGLNFTLVAEPRGAEVGPVLIARLQRAVDEAALQVEDGKAGAVRPVNSLLIAQITTSLEQTDAAERVPDMRDAIGDVQGVKTYLTGAPAIEHDMTPVYEEDLLKGETIAIPIALLVLAFMLGTLTGIAVPLLFALATIPVTLGGVWVVAHAFDMAEYVQNIVTLIGLAIAIDYSMLVVFRFREELRRNDSPTEALVTTMETAGHATIFSGMTVAVGLGLLIFMPLPFMQSMGIGGVLVPLVSIAAAATLLPALLAVMGAKVNRLRVVPKSVLERRSKGEGGVWARLAQSIMRRPVPYLAISTAIMIALAVPATEMDLTGGDNRGLPETTEATQGLGLLDDTLGPGALSPNQIVVDTGAVDGAWGADMMAAQRRLAAKLSGDPEIDNATVETAGTITDQAGVPPDQLVGLARKSNLVDRTGRYVQIRAAGRHDTGSKEAQDLVERIRDRYVPESGFPAGADVTVTGAAAFGVDFIDVAYGAFPFLILAVLLISYLILLRAFRSLFLPLKAVALNCLSVAATYGVLVLVFQHELGANIGLDTSPQVEAWIPIFLFAMLFGLSMDYEVFLLSRMREEWDKRRNNEDAVAFGLQHTGRIITAAAIIMIAAFAGFTAGTFVGLQMFGVGLSIAILLDATIVRMIMVPATMKLMGDWNWYLPDRVARWMRIKEPTVPEPDLGDAGPDVVDEATVREWLAGTPHAAGLWIDVGQDGALHMAAVERMRRTLRPGDAFADLGGGRMAVFLPDLRSHRDAAAAADRIERRLREPFKIGDELVEARVDVTIEEHVEPRPESVA